MKEIERSNFIVRQDLVDPPSIGSKDLSFDPVGNRVRQIVEKIVEGEEELGVILDSAERFGKMHQATRIVARVLMSSGIYIANEKDHFRQEAKIPLAGEFKGLSLCYYGMNSLDRQTTDSVTEQEKKMLDNVLKRQPKTPLAIFKSTKGFKLERLQGDISIGDYERIKVMYENSFTAYPFDIVNSIKLMARKDDYTVFAARSIVDGMLYAICITEEMALRFPDGKRFVMREMGDSAKIPEVNGLNAPLKLMLVNEAYKDGVDLVFCESRAASYAVNAVNQDVGMRYSGFLMQHTRIGGEGIDEKSRYGNMNVWALNKDDIRKVRQET